RREYLFPLVCKNFVALLLELRSAPLPVPLRSRFDAKTLATLLAHGGQGRMQQTRRFPGPGSLGQPVERLMR
ncbi:MAG: hypothetical protein LBP52_06375, partial [Burkholderiaceae bacterium]|nr:hypothetical protein [Burkholderiaceae bacterium]